IFFPRLASPFWSVPMDTGTGTTGISDSMSPGDISSLSQSDAVAFRVKFDDRIPAPRERYWRGLVLTMFNGRSWTQDDAFEGPGVHEQISGEGRPIAYQVTLEPTRQRWVFALDMPWTWTLDGAFMGRQQQLARLRPVDQRVAYDVVSYPDYRTTVNLTDYARRWYLRVPMDSNERTRALAVQMRADAGSDTDFVNAVLRKFNQEEYFYTLEPPPLGSNSVDRFLFETRRGFCEHYASAFAVMMRSAGVPARVVVGYQGGEMNPMAGHMIVRQSDAHAWTEVWLNGRGWYRVDPTAAVAPERIDAGRSGAMLDGIAAAWGLSAPPAWVHQLTLTWDAMNAKWNDWVLGYGPETQERFMQWLGMDDPDWRQMMFTLIGIVVALVAIISLLLMLRYRPPQRDHAAILYDRFVRKTGVARAIGETPAAFAGRVRMESPIAAGTINEVTETYLEARYGPTDLAMLNRLENSVRTL
ncbi:MAG: DUF3488 and transglutaminase-like domain-containing protein, partial [Planctomycetota bacterium]|nr:DUF3488 and transglutaminase-like domain-containing protein [Planctomycetota bacterium]